MHGEGTVLASQMRSISCVVIWKPMRFTLSCDLLICAINKLRHDWILIKNELCTIQITAQDEPIWCRVSHQAIGPASGWVWSMFFSPALRSGEARARKKKENQVFLRCVAPKLIVLQNSGILRLFYTKIISYTKPTKKSHQKITVTLVYVNCKSSINWL